MRAVDGTGAAPPPRDGGCDVLLVSLGATPGLRASDAEFAAALRRAGATVVVAEAAAPPEVRTFALTDLTWALTARRATLDGLRAHPPRAIVYSTVTAALLAPRPGAIRFDAPAVGNRPGRHGVWQRPLERRRLAAAPLLVGLTGGTFAEAAIALPDPRAVVCPIPVEPSGPAPAARDVAAITYGTNPHKKGLDRTLAAWRAARRDDEVLLVAGLDGADEPGVRYIGRLHRDAYRSLLRRARVFVNAARREDYGIAQLEALADGCALVTTASAGPYAALPIARALDPRLVGDDLPRAIRTALDDPVAGYARRAAEALRPFTRAAVDATVATAVLPRLLDPAPGRD